MPENGPVVRFAGLAAAESWNEVVRRTWDDRRAARRAGARAVSDADAGLRLPPHSIEAEQSLLGGLMLDASAWLEVAERVSADDFYRPQHRMVFGVLADLADADEPIDNVTVRDALSNRSLLDKAGGATYLVDLVESTPGASNVAAYARIVRERATLRRLLAAANGIAASTLDPEGRDSEAVLDEAEREVFAIRDGRATENAPQRAEELVVGVKERLEYLAEHGGEVTGVASGFADLDRLTAGFQPTDLVVVAARPSMGKTALMVNMAEHAVLSDEGPPGAVLVFSLEQPADQVVSRMLSSMGRIDQTRMRTGDLDAGGLGPLREGDGPAAQPAAVRGRHGGADAERDPRPRQAGVAGGGRIEDRDGGLPAADEFVDGAGEPDGGDLGGVALAEGAGEGAALPGGGVLAAEPEPGAAPGQASAAVGPAGVGRDRAGRGRDPVHLPRRGVRRGQSGPGPGGDHRGQAAQRADRRGEADVHAAPDALRQPCGGGAAVKAGVDRS